MRDEPRAIATAFLGGDEIAAASPLGSGHIHQTWRVTSRRGSERRQTVLQRINTRVFTAPETLCANLDRITQHLRSKLAAAGTPDVARRCLTPLRTASGALLAHDAAGAPWRAFVYVEGTRTADRIEGRAQAHDAARAFARFAADLSDLPAPPLVPTLSNFHDLAPRIRDLEAAAAADAHARAAGVASEIATALRSWDWVRRELDATGSGDLPARVMHGDCKLNNLLLDRESGEGLCVIDLDTTMDATILADFGQLVRTGVSRAAEDETRLERVRFERELFDALAAGYLAGFGDRLEDSERAALPLAGPVVTLQNAVRFLTDHLAGDVYFRVHRPGHNRDRARAQLRLFQCLRENRDAMRRRVEALAVRSSP